MYRHSLYIFISTAVDASLYAPLLSKRKSGVITIVALSRMVYRKGIDLLAAIMPVIARRHPNVEFIIGVWISSSTLLWFYPQIVLFNVSPTKKSSCLLSFRWGWTQALTPASNCGRGGGIDRSSDLSGTRTACTCPRGPGTRPYFPQLLAHGSLLHGHR